VVITAELREKIMAAESRLPVPVQVEAMEFLFDPKLPAEAVLEFITSASPIRLFLTKPQLEELSKKAAAAASKID
jgi:hypothetical protein